MMIPDKLQYSGTISYTANFTAPVAQLDRVGGFEPLGRGFESLRVHQLKNPSPWLGFFNWHSRRFDLNPCSSRALQVRDNARAKRRRPQRGERQRREY